MNPYGGPVHLWSEETRAARLAMPTNEDGFVVNPRFMPKREAQRGLTFRWREWSRRFHPRLWPSWLEGWFAEAKARGITT